jgi:hypothetical protein
VLSDAIMALQETARRARRADPERLAGVGGAPKPSSFTEEIKQAQALSETAVRK